MSKNLEEYSREELIEEIKSLKKQKKFGLVWEDKPEKVVKDCETKLPVVKEVEEKAIENAPGEPTNIIIEGDNYHALSVLNYTHAGKIDVIYIDPPYNTGNKDFVYNDCYVDKEDSFRHSKWLSFMDKRLRLAKNLLADDGVIFISIDDNEQATLKLLCDYIFNERNYHGMITWIKKTKPVNMGSAQYSLQSNTEYILVYGIKPQDRHNYNLPEVSPKDYPFSDERGEYRVDRVDQRKNIGSMRRDSMLFEMLGVKPKAGFRWQLSPQKKDQLLSQDRLFEKGGNIYIKTYKNEDEKKSGLEPFWTHRCDVPTAEAAKEDLEKLMNCDDVFQTVKPVELIRQMILFASKKDGVIMDFFAGSGTTGQAVMELNKEDGGHRQFILVTNNESQIAENVTYPRIKTVITGNRPDGTKYSDGIPANLRYFRTDFVEKGKTTDDTREALITECCDMIRIRENAFEYVASTPEYRFYKNDTIFVPIIFDQFAIAETWEKVEELNRDKLPVHCYNFSYNRHANEEEIPEDTGLEWIACSIPETVLEVYKKIFKRREN